MTTTVSVPTDPGSVPDERPAGLHTIVSVRSCDGDVLGPDNLILALAPEFTRRGIRHVLVNLWDGEPPRVALHEEAVRRGLESYVISAPGRLNPVLFPRLGALLRSLRPDVIVTHDVKSEVASYAVTRLSRPGLIGVFYGRLAVRSAWLKFWEMVTLVILRLFDRVLANSGAQRAQLMEWWVPGRKVDVLPSFSDTSVLHPPSPEEAASARQALGIEPQRPVLSTLARLAAQKGHRYLLQALVEIRHEFPDVLYLVVGDADADWRGEGGIREELEELIRTLDLAPNVRFLGYRRDILTVLHATDILVSPSLREGMSVTLVEAMAAGVPIVATAVGGSPEAIVDGETGLLVPPADPRALATAVLTLLRDPARRAAMGAAARRRAEARFDVGAAARQVLQNCEAAVRARRGPRR
ncbi:MAG TPA: glycosyltransferase family 4 protein [Chloroflexota bacterium]|nr:glycosyltransferase family 4 protein [Chloroflexota bacterium]